MAIVADDAWNGWDSYESAGVTNSISNGVLSCVSDANLRAQRYVTVEATPGDVFDLIVEARCSLGNAHLFCNVGTITGTLLADRDVRASQWQTYRLRVTVPQKYEPGLIVLAVGTFASDSLSSDAQFMRPRVARNGAPVLAGFAHNGLALNAVGGVTLWAGGANIIEVTPSDTILTSAQVATLLADQFAIQANSSLLEETKSYIARFSVVPSSGFIDAVNALIVALKDGSTGNFWSGLDLLLLLNGTERAGTLVNARNPASSAIVVGNPNWVAKEGWQGTGLSSYIDTRYNPGDGGVYNLTTNLNSFGVWTFTNVQVPSGGYDFGSDQHCLVARAALGPNGFYSRNSSGTSNNVIPASLGAGHYVTDRASSGNYQRYQGLSSSATMTALASQTQSSVSVQNQRFYICRRPGSAISNTNRFSIVHAGGGGYSALEWDAIQSAFKTYVDTVSALP